MQNDIVKAAKWFGGALIVMSLVLAIGVNLAVSKLRLPSVPVQVNAEVTVRPKGEVPGSLLGTVNVQFTDNTRRGK